MADDLRYGALGEASANRPNPPKLPTATADVAHELRSQIAMVVGKLDQPKKLLMQRLVLRLTGPLPDPRRSLAVDEINSGIDMLASALSAKQPQDQLNELKAAINQQVTQVERLLVDSGRTV